MTKRDKQAVLVAPVFVCLRKESGSHFAGEVIGLGISVAPFAVNLFDHPVHTLVADKVVVDCFLQLGKREPFIFK